MADSELNPNELIDLYGADAAVVAGGPPGVAMTLGQALQAEALFCPADTVARQDPVKRLAYLATMLAAAGTLRSEHVSLLGKQE